MSRTKYEVSKEYLAAKAALRKHYPNTSTVSEIREYVKGYEDRSPEEKAKSESGSGTVGWVIRDRNGCLPLQPHLNNDFTKACSILQEYNRNGAYKPYTLHAIGPAIEVKDD